MIVMKNIRQPFGPSYGGIVTKNIQQPYGPTYGDFGRTVIKNPSGYGRMVMKNPMGYGNYGIILNQPARVFNGNRGYRGFGDDDGSEPFDWSGLAKTAAQSLPDLLKAGTGIATTVIGANKTGTATVGGQQQSIPGSTGYSTPGGAYATPSFFSSIPTPVWIAGGALVVGAAVILFMK